MKKKDLYIELAMGWLATSSVCIGAILISTIEMYITAFVVTVVMLIANTIGCYILDEISKKKPN